MKIINDSCSIGGGWSNIKRHGSDSISGIVITTQGIVEIYAQGNEEYIYASRLNFAWKGRMYLRTFDKRYSPRGIVTKAKQFAKEIVIPILNLDGTANDT